MANEVVPSRYNRTPRYRVKLDDGSAAPMLGFRRTTLPAEVLTSSIQHRVLGGDDLQSIATQYYGAPEYWSVLADANPQVFFPGDLDLFEGQTILVPDVTYVRAL